MPIGKPIPATMAQLARFGHIAGTLRSAMQEQDPPWTTNVLITRLGIKGTAPYGWIAGKSGPSAGMRRRLVKLFPGVPHDAWLPRESQSKNVPALAPPSRPPEVMSVNVSADGRARIRLDVTLPVVDAMPLIRMLFDQGLVSRETTRENE